MRIRKAQKTDAKKIFELHLKAAEIKDGVARMPKEIFLHDIEDFVDEALQKGLIFVGEIDEKIIAEIHCYKNFPHWLFTLIFISSGWVEKFFLTCLKKSKTIITTLPALNYSAAKAILMP